MQIAETRLAPRGLLRTINEVVESAWVFYVKVISESSSVVEGRVRVLIHALVRVVNEIIQASWTFAMTKIVGESEEAREGSFESVIKLFEIITEAVQLIASSLRVVAAKLVRVIGDSITVYDSLTRLVAKAITGIVMVIGDAIGISESWFAKRVKDRRITRWLERRTRR